MSYEFRHFRTSCDKTTLSTADLEAFPFWPSSYSSLAAVKAMPACILAVHAFSFPHLFFPRLLCAPFVP
ncbi:MAG: hypothetical protein LKJ44_04295 [Bifidobacteriaceae bacterium]|jgi:hypothetical protein|nr:hypothetical protein [Bifidobacteriaceae bacterium]